MSQFIYNDTDQSHINMSNYLTSAVVRCFISGHPKHLSWPPQLINSSGHTQLTSFGRWAPPYICEQ